MHAAGLPVILDVKRGDIASTADAYAKAGFDVLGADAITVNPLLGGDSVETSPAGRTRACSSSAIRPTPGARDLQELQVGREAAFRDDRGKALGLEHAGQHRPGGGRDISRDACPRARIAPDMWILLPGVGAQGGDLEASLAAGLDAGGSRVLVNVSRAICRRRTPARRHGSTGTGSTHAAPRRHGKAPAAPSPACSGPGCPGPARTGRRAFRRVHAEVRAESPRSTSTFGSS